MKCAVIGSPISHSLSPVLHMAAYAWLGLDWTYERHEVSAEGVPAFLASLGPQWRGLSATMPCKEAIVSCGRPDSVVQALGVGNTLIFDGQASDPATTRVANTDVLGIQSVLESLGVTNDDAVEVWGNGATARSALYALANRGVGAVSVLARNSEKTASLAQDAKAWGLDVTEVDTHLSDHSQPPAVVISTVPGHAAIEHVERLAGTRAVFDVLYNPWPTPLIQEAGRSGVHVATGLDLLAAQAVGQVLLMTGQDVPLPVLREAADKAVRG
ncbi:MAG: shikimate dehydrogenase [Propionibacteriaceae bacterium]|jgi:shikimate dehydrogenase|nr:shikimate dehydrogenase [Propionibacteriaceae bacterium]